jgi:hypothetical protein
MGEEEWGNKTGLRKGREKGGKTGIKKRRYHVRAHSLWEYLTNIDRVLKHIYV